MKLKEMRVVLATPENLNNMKKAGLVLAGIIAIWSMTSCRSTKKIQSVIGPKDSTVTVVPKIDNKADSVRFINEVLADVQKNHIDFQTFSAKIKVDFEGGDGKKNDFNAFLRMKKDSAIWVSINAALGIEAFRILITPTEVKVLNKIDKEIQERSASYLKEVSKVPINFYDLQALLIGNPVQLDTNVISYNKQEGSISLVSVGEIFKHFLTVTDKDRLVITSKLDDVDGTRARTALISYGGYQTNQGVKFPTDRRITATEKSKIDIKMEYKQYSFNEPLNFPFPIPKNYKRL